MALEEMNRAAGDPVVRDILEYREKAAHDEASRNYWYERQGFEKGFAKGEKRGIKEGSLKEKKRIALKLLSQGLDIELVSKATGLPVKEIDSLINKNVH